MWGSTTSSSGSGSGEERFLDVKSSHIIWYAYIHFEYSDLYVCVRVFLPYMFSHTFSFKKK